MSSKPEETATMLPAAPAQNAPPAPPTTEKAAAEEERVKMLVAGKSPNRANISYTPPPAPKNYRPLKVKGTNKKVYDPNGVIAPPPAPEADKKAGEAVLPPPPPVEEAVVAEPEEEEEEEEEEEIVEYAEQEGDDKIFLLAFEKLPIAAPLDLEEKAAGTKLCGTTFVEYAVYTDSDFAVLSGYVAKNQASLDNIVVAKATISERIRKLRPSLPEEAPVLEERLANEKEGIYSDNSCHLQHALNGLKKDPKYAALVGQIQGDIKSKEDGVRAEVDKLREALNTVTDEDICEYLTSRIVIRGSADSKLHMLLINLTSDLTEAKDEGRLPAYRLPSKLLRFPAAYYTKRQDKAIVAFDKQLLEDCLIQAEDCIDKARINVGTVHDILENVSEAA